MEKLVDVTIKEIQSSKLLLRKLNELVGAINALIPSSESEKILEAVEDDDIFGEPVKNKKQGGKK